MYWYYAARGDSSRRGLVDELVLYEMAKKGALKPSDLVWNAAAGTKWISASRIPNLFPDGAVVVPAEPSAVHARPATKAQRMRQVVPALAGLVILCLAGIAVVVAVRLQTGKPLIPRRGSGKVDNPDQDAVIGIKPDEIRLAIVAATTSNEMSLLVEKVDLCLKFEQIAEAEMLLGVLSRYEQASDRTATFQARLDTLKRDASRRKELMDSIRVGKLAKSDAEELVKIYRDRKEEQALQNMAETILRDKASLTAVASLSVARMGSIAGWAPVEKAALREFVARSPLSGPPDDYLEVAKMFCRVEETQRAIEMLRQYVKNVPDSGPGWLELSAILAYVGDSKEALAALKKAADYGGDEACSVARRDSRFDSMRDLRSFRNLVGLK